MPDTINDHPIEDVFGYEIIPGDKYWVFGEEAVLDENLTRYLIEKQQVEYFKAR